LVSVANGRWSLIGTAHTCDIVDEEAPRPPLILSLSLSLSLLYARARARDPTLIQILAVDARRDECTRKGGKKRRGEYLEARKVKALPSRRSCFAGASCRDSARELKRAIRRSATTRQSRQRVTRSRIHACITRVGNMWKKQVLTLREAKLMSRALMSRVSRKTTLAV
jgi:hypothetical protein